MIVFLIGLVSCNELIRFPVIGDWGGYHLKIFPGGHVPTQDWGADNMNKQCENNSCDFLVGLGDNFYEYGVTDVDDRRFRGTYENIYGKTSSRNNIKDLNFYHIAGNHDHRGNATAQIIYTKTKDTNFYLPSFWYSFTIEKGTDFTMTFIMIDTNIMKGSGDTNNLPDSDVYDYRVEQNKWFEDEVKKCDSTYCIVVGHHPIFSVCSHGPTVELQEYLLPLLKQNYVDAYFCGHDHQMQHWFDEKIHHFISGLGEFPNPSLENLNNPLNPEKSFDYATILKQEKLGVLMVDATDEQINFRVVSGIGNEHYPRTLRKKTAV